MSTFEEDSSAYSFFSSDSSSLDDNSSIPENDVDTWISESCSNDSPITLLPYDKDDYDDIFTIKLQDKNGKFKKGSCLTRTELSKAFLSDRGKDYPEYIMSIYTTPQNAEDYVTGLSGKPTVRLVGKMMSNQIYVTIGSIKRIFDEPDNKVWYALPLFGGKRRRIGNILGTYGSSMNHGQVPGYIIYKLFTRKEIEQGAKGVDTLEDYFIIKEHMELLPFIYGQDESSNPGIYTQLLVDSILPDSYKQYKIIDHGMQKVINIQVYDNHLFITSRSDLKVIDLSANQVLQTISDIDEDNHIRETIVKGDKVYMRTQSDVYVYFWKTGTKSQKYQNHSKSDFTCMCLTDQFILIGTESGMFQIQQLDNTKKGKYILHEAHKKAMVQTLACFNEYIISSDNKGRAKLWIMKGQALEFKKWLNLDVDKSRLQTYDGEEVYVIAFVMATDMQTLYGLYNTAYVVKWNLESGNGDIYSDLKNYTDDKCAMYLVNDTLLILHGTRLYSVTNNAIQVRDEPFQAFAYADNKIYTQRLDASTVKEEKYEKQ